MKNERDLRIEVCVLFEEGCDPIQGEYQWCLTDILNDAVCEDEFTLIDDEVCEWVVEYVEESPGNDVATLVMKLEYEIDGYPHMMKYFTTVSHSWASDEENKGGV